MNPRVSIGMPVHNGQPYIAEAINSVVSQTFGDLELIISDNASTDQTESICREYAASDDRIIYCRSEVNRGAAWNFNRVARLARGEYFKWAAHDDVCSPKLLQRCVAVLDEHPDVVLCHTRVRLIDKSGNVIGDHDVPIATDSPKPHQRLRAVIGDHMCYAYFGLIRWAHLMQTPLLGTYAHADGVLLARLALAGRFHQVGEYLFHSRRHPAQSAGTMRDKYQYTLWFDPRRQGHIVLPNWRIDAEYARSVLASPLRAGDKARCSLAVAREFISDRRRLLRDLTMAIREVWRRGCRRRRVGRASGD